MSHRILITGSEGLIGTALRRSLSVREDRIDGLDLLGAGIERGDVRDPQSVRAAVASCDGIVHLAAVSRVVWGERDPEGCWATNVGGLRNVVQAALESERQPWLIFASSREVYGQPELLPAKEDAPLCPVNIYGRTKVAGEEIVRSAQVAGLRGGIVRLSNVYGSTFDHADRVVPAFARAAVLGEVLHVEGACNLFDFTHIDDTVRGILAIIDLLNDGLPWVAPLHLLTGQPTSLGELAELAVHIAGGSARIEEAPVRSYDVGRFWGDPSRAHDILGWRPNIDLVDGLGWLIDAFKKN